MFLSPQVYLLFFSLFLLNYSWAFWDKYKAYDCRSVIHLLQSFIIAVQFWIELLLWKLYQPINFSFKISCFQCYHDLFTCNFFLLLFLFWFLHFWFYYFFYFILQTNRNFLLSSFHSLIYDKFSSFGLAFASAGSLSFKYLLIDV